LLVAPVAGLTAVVLLVLAGIVMVYVAYCNCGMR